MGWVLFAIALSVTLTGAVLCVTLAGIPLLIAAAATIRWCADVERARLLPFCGDVGSHYRQQAAAGLLSRVRDLWRDPAIWRDIAYLLGMFVPLVTLDLIVLTVWLVLLAGHHPPGLVLGSVADHPRRPLPRLSARLLPERPARPPGLRLLHRHAAEGAARRGRLRHRLPALQLRPGGDRPRARRRRAEPARRAGRPAARGPRGTRPSRAAVRRGKRGSPRLHRGIHTERAAGDCPRPRGSSSRAGIRPRRYHAPRIPISPRQQKEGCHAPAAHSSIPHGTRLPAI